jgi:hypothetical protein
VSRLVPSQETTARLKLRNFFGIQRVFDSAIPARNSREFRCDGRGVPAFGEIMP